MIMHCSRDWSCTDHVTDHAPITWLIMHWSRNWSGTYHLANHALITWLIIHLCQPKAFNITFISQIKNLKPRKDNDVQKANFQILAKDLEIFQNTRCLGALGAHSLEFLIDSLKVCYSPDTVCTFKEFRPCGRSPQARSPKWQVLPHG